MPRHEYLWGGGREVQPYVFHTSALEVRKLVATRFGCFTPSETAHGTYWIESWLWPKAGLDGVVKRKITACSEKLAPVVRPVISELHWLDCEQLTEKAIQAPLPRLPIILPSHWKYPPFPPTSESGGHINVQQHNLKVYPSSSVAVLFTLELVWSLRVCRDTHPHSTGFANGIWPPPPPVWLTQFPSILIFSLVLR